MNSAQFQWAKLNLTVLAAKLSLTELFTLYCLFPKHIRAPLFLLVICCLIYCGETVLRPTCSFWPKMGITLYKTVSGVKDTHTRYSFCPLMNSDDRRKCACSHCSQSPLGYLLQKRRTIRSHLRSDKFKRAESQGEEIGFEITQHLFLQLPTLKLEILAQWEAMLLRWVQYITAGFLQ